MLALIANLVSAAVRLGKIGQTDGQKILAALLPRIRALAREAANSTLADLGCCASVSHMGKVFNFVRYKSAPQQGGAIDFDALMDLLAPRFQRMAKSIGPVSPNRPA